MFRRLAAFFDFLCKVVLVVDLVDLGVSYAQSRFQDTVSVALRRYDSIKKPRIGRQLWLRLYSALNSCVLIREYHLRLLGLWKAFEFDLIQLLKVLFRAQFLFSLEVMLIHRPDFEMWCKLCRAVTSIVDLNDFVIAFPDIEFTKVIMVYALNSSCPEGT